MIRGETVTDDMILISEGKGRIVEGQARSIWTENERHVNRCCPYP